VQLAFNLTVKDPVVVVTFFNIAVASFELTVTNTLLVDKHLLFERVPPSGIRLWLVWLKLRSTVSDVRTTLQERWEDGLHLSRRILRRLISGP
jgi:hypothetical protein